MAGYGLINGGANPGGAGCPAPPARFGTVSADYRRRHRLLHPSGALHGRKAYSQGNRSRRPLLCRHAGCLPVKFLPAALWPLNQNSLSLPPFSVFVSSQAAAYAGRPCTFFDFYRIFFRQTLFCRCHLPHLPENFSFFLAKKKIVSPCGRCYNDTRVRLPTGRQARRHCINAPASGPNGGRRSCSGRILLKFCAIKKSN